MPALLITLFTGPLGRWLAASLVVAALFAGTYALGRSHGRAAALAGVEVQNQKVRRVVDVGVQNVATCFARGAPWEWDSAAGQCFKLEPTR